MDWHSHLLPGLDDGAADIAEAVKIARSLADAGFSQVCCTPHLIKGSYLADNATIVNAVAELQAVLDGAGLGLQLVPGREYYLDEFLLESLKEPMPTGGSEFLLIEIPDSALAEMVADTLYRVRCSGFVPLIAHPERCPLLEPPRPADSRLMGWLKTRFSRLFQKSNFEPRTSNLEPDSLLEYLVGIGCRFQGNIGSFAGVYGEKVRGQAVDFLRRGLYTCLGSDAHRSRNLAGILDKGLREIERLVGAEELAGLPAGNCGNDERRRPVS